MLTTLPSHLCHEYLDLHPGAMILLVVVFVLFTFATIFGSQRFALHVRCSFFQPSRSQDAMSASRRPSLGKTETNILQDVKPYQFPPLRETTRNKIAMGLKRLDESNWLTLDDAYLEENTLRSTLLHSSLPQVVQCMPGSEAACHEVLTMVATFLSTRFPKHFTLTHSRFAFSEPTITNHITNETFPIGSSCQNPLETAARLAMEDFNVLIKDPETGEYHLQASATLFPAGWKLQERIMTSMANLHKPVPGWQAKLGGHVNHYFDRLSAKTAMERSNIFIQTTPQLFQDAPEASDPTPAKYLQVRRERQTFTRLERSDAVLFTVRTYMSPLMDLRDDELRALRSQVLGWEKEMRSYKGWNIWGESLLGWCEDRIGPAEAKAEVKENAAL